MKKIFLFLITILIVNFFVLTSLDTSDYRLEKKLWQVQKEFEQINRDPQVVPDQNFDNIINQYHRIIKNNPKSNLTPRIHIQIGKIYRLRKDFVSARKTYEEVLTLYPDNAELCSEAIFQVGLTYEEEKNISQAVKSYQRIMSVYPFTRLGLSVPLYIYNYLKKLGHNSDANVSLQEAVVFYQTFARQHSGTRKEFNALRLLSSAYLAQGKWEASVDTLSDVLLKFPSKEYLNPQRAQLLVHSINRISIMKLRNYDLPISKYHDFIKKYPKHGLNKYLEQTIVSIENLKAEGIFISPKTKK